MRRGILIVAIGLLVFAVAAVAGFLAAARLAPERLQAEVERRLGEALHAQVVLDDLHVTWGDEEPWLELRARGGRALGWADGRGDLEVERVSVQVDLVALVLGRLAMRSLAFENAEVVLWRSPTRPGDAGHQPPPPGSGSLVDAWVHRLDGWAHPLLARPCYLPNLRVTGLSLAVEGQSGEPVPWLRSGTGRFTCSAVGRKGHAELEAVWAGPEASRVPVRARLDATGARVEAEVTAGRGPLDGIARTLGIHTLLTGQIGGTVYWTASADGDHHVTGRLAGQHVQGPLGGRASGSALTLDLVEPRVRMEAHSTRGRAELDLLQIEDEGATFQADGAAQLPLGEHTPVRLGLQLVDVDPEALGHVLGQLSQRLRGPLNSLVERMEAGRVQRLRMEARSTPAGLREILAGGMLSRPGEVTLDGELADATIRIGTEDRAVDVDAHVHFDGRRLTVSDLGGRFRQRDLPRIEVVVTGLDQLRAVDELHCVRPYPVPTLEGLDAMRRWLASRREPQETSSWQSLHLELDWVSHPILLCGIEQVVAELRPATNGLDFTVERGVWAGLPVEATGQYREPAHGPARVVLAARVGPPFEAMAPTPPADPWAFGRFDMKAHRLGSWQIRGAKGRLVAEGGTLSLRDATLELGPQGRVQGDLALDLGHGGAPTYRVGAQAAAVDLRNVWSAAHLPVHLSGTLYGAAALEGSLQPGLNALADASGSLTLHARDGHLHRQLPIMLALVVASDRFNPFGSRDELPYDAIDLVGHLEHGGLTLDTLTVQAPSLRMGASGGALVADPRTVEGVVGIFFFPKLDALIAKVPLLNRVILGSNDNLVGAYYAITGSWDHPDASLIPIKSLAAAGPTSLIFEDLPKFVLGGIRRIQSALTPVEPAPEPAGASRADS